MGDDGTSLCLQVNHDVMICRHKESSITKFDVINGVAPLAMPRRWRTVLKKQNKRKRFRDRRATFTTVYVVGW
jgi:hypothetical protein